MLRNRVGHHAHGTGNTADPQPVPDDLALLRKYGEIDEALGTAVKKEISAARYYRVHRRSGNAISTNAFLAMVGARKSVSNLQKEKNDLVAALKEKQQMNVRIENDVHLAHALSLEVDDFKPVLHMFGKRERVAALARSKGFTVVYP